jgi:hypothetical protein
MPALKNQRHERFAQLLAKGIGTTDAYVEIGYTRNDGNASRLKGTEKIRARVSELTEKSAEKAALTLAGLMNDLMDIAKEAREAKQYGAARGAMMDLAKLNGWLAERVEHTGAAGGPIETQSELVVRFVRPE